MRLYSAFWLDYANGLLDLSPEFATRDQMDPPAVGAAELLSIRA